MSLDLENTKRIEDLEAQVEHLNADSIQLAKYAADRFYALEAKVERLDTAQVERLNTASVQFAMYANDLQTRFDGLEAKVERLEAAERNRAQVDRELILAVLEEKLVSKEDYLDAVREGRA